MHNDGGLSFSDVSAAAGMTHPGQYRHCSTGDFDNDGFIDIAVGNASGNDRLYHNKGNGTFADVAAAVGIATQVTSFGLMLEDFDNDGWLDLYVPKYQISPTGPSRLFRNRGDGTFEDVTDGSGMTGQTDMGHTTADIDGDGYPDIYIGTGNPQFTAPDVLFRVEPLYGGTTGSDPGDVVGEAVGFLLHDVTEEYGFLANGETRLHGMAVGDYDQDGSVDVYSCTGGPHGLPTEERNALWRGPANDYTWAGLALTGTASNRGAIGSVAWVTTDSGRTVYRYLRAGHGFGNTNSPVLHFGLADATGLERLDVRWPSGVEQTLLAPELETIHELVETGLLGVDTDPWTGVATLEACGPPHARVVVFGGPESTEIPAPEQGGVLRVAAPLFPLGSTALDEHGRAWIEVPSGAVEAGLVLQARIEPLGGAPVLTNALEL